MGYKTISMIVTDPAVDKVTFDAALEIAKAEAAHLDIHCLGIDPARYDMMAAGSAAVILDAGVAEARERAESNLAWVRSAVPAEFVTYSAQSVVVPQVGLDAMVARLVRYSDLILATKPYQNGRDPTLVNILESVLFGTGAPIVVVPEKGLTRGPAFRRILVAWNESDEFFDAIRQALPFLQAAEKVDIVLVDPPSHSPERSDPGGMVCMMLARHNVRAEVSILARTLPRVSDVIARFAREHDSDAIVMGAYGHSRFREAVLGGATRDLLESATVPLIMAH